MIQQKKVGIMGGTFNPIHNGHLLLAQQAKEYCGLDEILFIPSGNSYMKDKEMILDGSIRLSMTALAIEDNPDFTLSAIEVERGGNTYTCDTLRELRKKSPDTIYYFILGADNLFTVEYWKNSQEILSDCIFVAAARDGRNENELKEKVSELKKRYQARIIILPERKFDISSTEIRKRIAKGESVRYMVPDKVLQYIQKQHLYQPE